MDAQITVAIIAGVVTIITTFGGFMLGRVKERQNIDRQTELAISNGVRTLLAFRLYDITNEAGKAGHINSEEIAMARDIYNQYHNLGGNGIGTDRMNYLETLPRDRGHTSV